MGVIILITLIGCGTNNVKDTRTLEDFKSAFEEKGYELVDEGEPLYQLIGAINGTIFYVDGQVFKIYQFENTSTYDKAIKDSPLLEDMSINGLFAAESSSQELLTFFESIENKS